jgi:hypothetical protein
MERADRDPRATPLFRHCDLSTPDPAAGSGGARTVTPTPGDAPSIATSSVASGDSGPSHAPDPMASASPATHPGP